MGHFAYVPHDTCAVLSSGALGPHYPTTSAEVAPFWTSFIFFGEVGVDLGTSRYPLCDTFKKESVEQEATFAQNNT